MTSAHFDGIPWKQLPDNCGGEDQIRLRDEIKAVHVQLDKLGTLHGGQAVAREQARDHLGEGLRACCRGLLLQGATRLRWAWAYQMVAERDGAPPKFLSAEAMPAASQRQTTLPYRLGGEAGKPLVRVPAGVSDPHATMGPHEHTDECEHEHD